MARHTGLPREDPFRLADTLAKRFEIQNVDVAVRGNLNHSGSPQPRELARNCSNRQAEKVANFGARKRKIESRDAVAPCKRTDLPNHHHKKAGYLFVCRLASERQHPLATLIDLAKGLEQQFCFEGRIFFEHLPQRVPGYAADLNIRTGFDPDRALVLMKSSDEIGRELKSDDLLTTIGQSLSQLEHAAHDIGIGSDRPLLLQENVAGGYLHDMREFGEIH